MANTAINWDIKLKEPIRFFDPKLTYEITKYRPVDEEEGLDFDPDWFREAAITKARTGRYSNFPIGSLSHRKFWLREIDRCIHGMEANGYRITGDHYFFINYHVLLNVSKVTQAGQGRPETTADFWSKHYEYFHYIEMCEKLGRDVIAFKARGVGFSEIAVALVVRPFVTVRKYQSILVAFSENLLEPTTSKAWTQLEYLNAETEGGMHKLRQNIDQSFHKQASYKDITGQKKGFFSEIKGIVVDDPRKLRGRRIDRLIYEEAGSNPKLIDTYVKGNALVEINGNKIGTRVVFGTGGDSGPALAGLDKMFKNVEAFKGLPYRHNHTRDGKTALTGFFIPAFSCVSKFKNNETQEWVECMDHRGVTNTKLAKQYYDAERRALAHLPKELLDYCAEYCYYPEEALIKQGQNNFNQVLLAEQYAELEIHKTVEKPRIGNLFWVYEGKTDVIKGVKWKDDPNGDIYISEMPELDETGSPIKNLYVAGIDAIDHGVGDSVVGEKGSQFCIVIKKRTFGNSGNKYVARYMDRPHNVRVAFQNAAMLLWLFGCKANLEDTKISFRTWLRDEKLDSKMLMTRPSYAMAVKGMRQNRQKTLWGTPASEKMIMHGLELIAQFVDDYYFTINDIVQLEQLQKFSYEDKGSFDCVMAMVYCEIGDEDMFSLRVVREELNPTQFQDVGYYVDDNGIKRFGLIPNEHNAGNYGETSNSNGRNW